MSTPYILESPVEVELFEIDRHACGKRLHYLGFVSSDTESCDGFCWTEVEGCYIDTALFGSIGAPELIELEAEKCRHYPEMIGYGELVQRVCALNPRYLPASHVSPDTPCGRYWCRIGWR